MASGILFCLLHMHVMLALVYGIRLGCTAFGPAPSVLDYTENVEREIY